MRFSMTTSYYGHLDAAQRCRIRSAILDAILAAPSPERETGARMIEMARQANHYGVDSTVIARVWRDRPAVFVELVG